MKILQSGKYDKCDFIMVNVGWYQYEYTFLLGYTSGCLK